MDCLTFVDFFNQFSKVLKICYFVTDEKNII
jgi:hypothetical protein